MTVSAGNPASMTRSLRQSIERLVARLEIVTDWQLFAFSVLWVVTAGLALQLVILPYVTPFAHAGHGLIANLDPLGFYSTSIDLAERIRREGLAAWWFMKDGVNDYVVAVSSLFYLIYPEPWILLPFNGVLCGVTVVVVRRTLAVVSDSRGVALVSLLPFFMFPTFVMIWGQPHKDLNSGMGFSLVLYALVLAAYGTGKAARLPASAILGGVGMAIMWLSRPYALLLMAAGTLVFMTLALFSRQCRRGRLLTVTAIVLLAASAFERRFDLTAPTAAATAPAEADADESVLSRRGMGYENCLPAARDAIDTFLFNVCLVRQGYIAVGTRAGSSNGYDYDIRLRSAQEFVAYIPRAIAVSLLEPGPQRWRTEQTTVGRLATLFVPLEMMAAYAAFLLALILGRRRMQVLAAAAFCITYIAIYAVAVPQLGSLYRMRAFAFAILIATAFATALQGFRRVAAPASEPLS